VKSTEAKEDRQLSSSSGSELVSEAIVLEKFLEPLFVLEPVYGATSLVFSLLGNTTSIVPLTDSNLVDATLQRGHGSTELSSGSCSCDDLMQILF